MERSLNKKFKVFQQISILILLFCFQFHCATALTNIGHIHKSYGVGYIPHETAALLVDSAIAKHIILTSSIPIVGWLYLAGSAILYSVNFINNMNAG